MSVWNKVFGRNSKGTVDGGERGNNLYNEAAGASKVMIVCPDIAGPYVGGTGIGAGKLIKITAAGTYSLTMENKAHDIATPYQKGMVVTEAGGVWVCSPEQGSTVTGAFDAQYWNRVADAVIAGIPNAAGDVVSTGRWHNAISVAGFVVEDESEIALNRAK